MNNPFMNADPRQFLQTMVQRNPNMLQNQQIKSYYDTLMSGDQSAITNLAQNLCNSYGVTPQQGLQQFQSFISQQMGGMGPR